MCIRDRYDEIVPKDDPTQVLSPLNFYELAASRIGFLPEPFAFSVRAFRRVADLVRAGQRFDLVHDVQCLGYGLLGLKAMGLPVVTTVHHPLTVDRRASFVRDETFKDAVGTMKFYPIGMQAFVARRLDTVFTSSEVSGRQIVQDFGVRPDRLRNVRNGLDIDHFAPDSKVPKSESSLLCVGRSTDPNKGIRTLMGPFPVNEGPAAGQSVLYFFAPWGLQMEAISFPKGMAFEKDGGPVLWSNTEPAK